MTFSNSIHLRIVSYFYVEKFFCRLLRLFGRAGKGLVVWRRNDVKKRTTAHNRTFHLGAGQTGVFNHGQFKRVADEFSIVVGVNSAAHTFKNDEIDV